MSELLFRARWIEESGGYRCMDITPESDLTLCFGNEDAFLQMYSNGGEHVDEWPVDVDQYTGLDDRNGKRIFKSDILRIIGPVLTPRVYRVNYRSGCFMADWVLNGKTEDEEGREVWDTIVWHELMESSSRIEVIGTAYENPELLNGDV